MPEYIHEPTIIPTVKIMNIAGIAVAKRSVIPSSKSFQRKPTRHAIHDAYAAEIINKGCTGISKKDKAYTNHNHHHENG